MCFTIVWSDGHVIICFYRIWVCWLTGKNDRVYPVILSKKFKGFGREEYLHPIHYPVSSIQYPATAVVSEQRQTEKLQHRPSICRCRVETPGPLHSKISDKQEPDTFLLSVPRKIQCDTKERRSGQTSPFCAPGSYFY